LDDNNIIPYISPIIAQYEFYQWMLNEGMCPDCHLELVIAPEMHDYAGDMMENVMFWKCDECKEVFSEYPFKGIEPGDPEYYGKRIDNFDFLQW